MAVATMGVTVLDCPDPLRLAEFYGAVLGWEVARDQAEEEGWVELHAPEGRRLAFQEAPDFVPPRWPSAEHGQQFHLDLDVPRAELESAERAVLRLGATLAQGDEDGRRGFRVYLDPAGHPFCLCVR